MKKLELKSRYKSEDLEEIAEVFQEIASQVGFKVSARGWCYIMETHRLINKDEFDKVANLINKCRKEGYLPIDFCAEDDARMFKGVETPADETIHEDFGRWIDASFNCAEHYHVDWWEDEQYYIQMVVEKVDLVTLFSPVCRKYHIPIANAKGWSSMLQRAQYARRFKEAEDRGMKCVLLYCGDHDPDGLRISDFLRKNLEDVSKVNWGDGEIGYDPRVLKIERFGLNKDFIDNNNLTWIDNLITGSGKNLADPNHRNYNMEYLQEYLKKIGERKCEANALVVAPEEGMRICEEAIIKYVGGDALQRFELKRQKVRDDFQEFLDNTNVEEKIDEIKNIIKNY